MQKIVVFSLACGFSLLTSCASVVSGTHQTISVTSPPVSGALCVLENNKGKWYLNSTPGSVVVHRSYQDLKVTCKKQGYSDATVALKSKTQAAALGNILLGGGIGAGVDMANGSAYEYPLEVKVPLRATRK